ncbi:hypothetical protein DYI25_04150 [Mesobacillus boroniphilus]|uniref:Uncharacterized protein n=1 Tax=Mesobacillus boroniphilus TaxID=308892 RepID=A0A944GVL0_9BACI|nr:hypothetical protein [Mesobacillus boroniphilus]MBS8263634.1 hypothetical protein [Mesobacillus boroniphilus]
MDSKNLTYISIFVIAALIFLSIYQYNKIADLEMKIGSDFQRTVRDSIFALENDGDPALWIKILQEEDGEFTFASHLGELTLLSRKYHMMAGKISMIGPVLDSLTDQYRQLAINMKSGKDSKENEKRINKDREFLISLLNEVDSIPGESERRYYSEFTNSDSRTSNLVWREYKKYEKR